MHYKKKTPIIIILSFTKGKNLSFFALMYHFLLYERILTNKNKQIKDAKWKKNGLRNYGNKPNQNDCEENKKA